MVCWVVTAETLWPASQNVYYPALQQNSVPPSAPQPGERAGGGGLGNSPLSVMAPLSAGSGDHIPWGRYRRGQSVLLKRRPQRTQWKECVGNLWAWGWVRESGKVPGEVTYRAWDRMAKDQLGTSGSESLEYTCKMGNIFNNWLSNRIHPVARIWRRNNY